MSSLGRSAAGVHAWTMPKPEVALTPGDENRWKNFFNLARERLQSSSLSNSNACLFSNLTHAVSRLSKGSGCVDKVPPPPAVAATVVGVESLRLEWSDSGGPGWHGTRLKTSVKREPCA